MKEPEFIQARSGLGGNKAGTEKGPREIISRLEIDSSRIVENRLESTDKPGDAKNEEQIAEFCRELSDTVSKTIDEDKLPVILGGDHSISIGSINGAAENYPSLGVIWIDAHADFNTPETSPSSNIHGMPVATALGKGRLDWGDADLEEENIVMIGIRDTDEEEQENLEESDITVFRMEDVREKGIEKVLEETIDILSDVKSIHVSFDLDFLDAKKAPGVGTPVENGGTIDEVVKIIRRVSKESQLRSLDIVELNPTLDENGRTAEKAVELIRRSFLEIKPKKEV